MYSLYEQLCKRLTNVLLRFIIWCVWHQGYVYMWCCLHICERSHLRLSTLGAVQEEMVFNKQQFSIRSPHIKHVYMPLRNQFVAVFNLSLPQLYFAIKTKVNGVSWHNLYLSISIQIWWSDVKRKNSSKDLMLVHQNDYKQE